MHFNVAWTNHLGELKVVQNYNSLDHEEEVAKEAGVYTNDIYFFSETPEDQPNYKELLAKYLAHVEMSEGIDFLGPGYLNNSDIKFTDEEINILRNINFNLEV